MIRVTIERYDVVIREKYAEEANRQEIGKLAVDEREAGKLVEFLQLLVRPEVTLFQTRNQTPQAEVDSFAQGFYR